MRICIDARSLRDTVTGLGRYAAHLVGQIARLDRENEYIVIRRPSRLGTIAHQGNFREIFVPYDISSAQNILSGARLINPLQADIYHALFHFLPIGVRARRIVITLHDLIWIDHRSLADDRRWRRWAKGRLGGLGIQRATAVADHIITVSASTRQAALAAGALDASKLTTIHHGVAPVFASAATAPLPDICRERDFIFALGNSLPYKNMPRLLRAFAILAPHHPQLFLLLAGRGASYPRLAQLVGQLGLVERVLFSGQLSDIEVRSCFTHARFFAFPSLVEGFGLPVLEAMAVGCPVLTSSAPSLVEITGTDAVHVDPLDVESIAEGMQRLLENPALCRQLGARGRRRAARFTWGECARKTLGIYRDLHSDSGAQAPAESPLLQKV